MQDIGIRVVGSTYQDFRKKILPQAGGDRALGIAVTAAMLALMECKALGRWFESSRRHWTYDNSGPGLGPFGGVLVVRFKLCDPGPQPFKL